MRQALATLTVALCGVVTVAAGTAAPTAKLDVSANWSGFTATGVGSTSSTASPAMSFTDATATWKQPKATCVAGQETSAAIWVGLGGYSLTSQALEQAGTEADCDANGKPSYSVWYELVPADSVDVKLKVVPGDTITTSVLATGTDITVQVKNRTRHTAFTKHLTMAAPDLTSAEWIVESPDICEVGSNRCQSATLTNFGSVSFTKVAALGNGQGGRLTGPGWQSTDLKLVPYSARGRSFGFAGVRSKSSAGAQTSKVAADGSGFSVGYLANAS